MLSVPGYETVESIHEGTQTLVLRAVRKTDGARVLLKTLRTETPTAEQFARASHEYEVMKKLDGAGAPRVEELAVVQNRPVLVMADSGGQLLRERLAGRPLPLGEFFPLALRMVEALGKVHAGAVIHKNLNPWNFVVCPGDAICVVGFAFATLLSRETARVSGNVVEGTLAYMSPEQTGRINRAVDSRTDLYALGATFYEMLAGRVPFPITDRLELVHAQIARQPTPLDELDAGLPPLLARIVDKLLSKPAEERYQSCAGIAADLQACAESWRATGQAPPRPLGLADVPDRMRVPQKLYGRERETRVLLEAFERSAGRATELLLVGGGSGIGKSALVHEIHRPIAERRGFFLTGKFEQYHRSRPYHAIIQALGALARLILAESAGEVARWRARIATALEPNGGVLTALVPEMERLLGPQPPALELSAAETQNRFHLVLQNFLRVVARREHPIVLALDDLQWADLPTLDLLELFATDSAQESLLIVGTYRTSEVSGAHALTVMADRVEKRAQNVHRITLPPLDLEDITHLVADTTGRSRDASRPLARFLLDRTAGNPFFLNQLLMVLHDQGAFRWGPRERAWQWDLEQIRTARMTDDLIGLMVSKIQTFSPASQGALKLAACVGHAFDLMTLSVVYRRGILETGDALWEPLRD
ncbi:MAG TPA: AAA family ATPase, partial [Polyangiaceae bacterium]